MVKIHLDSDQETPLYRQIVGQIRRQVALGELTAGERLPTVRQLAHDLKVDRNTALRAYRTLQREGVISLQHGRGTFVRSHPRHARLTPHRRALLETTMDASISRALSMGFAADEISQAFEKRMKSWQKLARRKGVEG